ncbi:MAG: glycosyltransferase [Ignavibacteriaceae bacterium]|jgi:GT2 family glycosyltransferase
MIKNHELENIMTNSHNPLFSVIVPAYNQSEYLRQALDSISAQTYSNWEAIIVNDGSTDETPKVMNEYAQKDSRFKCIHKKNGGTASALNCGIKEAKGDWINWLSSDDLFEKNKLEVHYNAIIKNPDIEFFFTNWYLLFENSGNKNAPQTGLEQISSEYFVSRFFVSNYINGITVAIKRNVFNKTGCFDEKYQQGQDYDMWLRICARYPSMFINSRTSTTRIHSAQGTNSFVQGCLLDSSRSCIDFINKHSFEEIFPLFDFNNPSHLSKAISEVIKICLNPDAYIYKFGYSPILLDKMRDWLNKNYSKKVIIAIIKNLSYLVAKIESYSIPSQLKNYIFDFLNYADRKFVYKSYDFIVLGRKYEKELRNSNRTEDADALANYLDKFDIQTDKKSSVLEPANKSINNENIIPRVSIIIPVYNNLNLTSDCLESIRLFTRIRHEIILIDNGSSEDIESLKLRHPDLKIIRNNVNKGFPIAVNQGIRHANGENILIANNDIIVSEGWLERLVEVINSKPEIGIVGPISNSVSGLQLDTDANYKSQTEYINYSRTIKTKNKGKVFEFPRIVFLCALIKKEVIAKIGGLDERFSPGNLEDDDFCLRAQLAGYKAFIVKDVFIHHYGSSSFKKQGEEAYLELISKNRKIFMDKWSADPEDIWIHKKPFYENRSIVFSLDPDFVSDKIKLVYVCIQNKEYQKALDNLEEVLDYDENFLLNKLPIQELQTLFHLGGKLCLIQKLFNKAENYFNKEIKINPNSLRGYKALGDAYLALGREEEAAKMYDKLGKRQVNDIVVETK